MSTSDVLILGSGISALTSGLLLASRGKKVTLLEQYVKPGGYMHSFRRFDETFDTGAHYVGAMGEGQPFRALLRYLGVFDEALFSPLDPEGFDVLSFPRGQVLIPQGYENVISEWSRCFPGEKDAIRRYFDLVARVCRHFPTYQYDDATHTSFPPEALERSLHDVVSSLTSHAGLKGAIYAYCNLHGVAPQDVAFGFHAIVTDSLVRGPYGLNGGGDELTNRFVRAIEALGGRVLCKHQVTEIEVRDRQVHLVRCRNGAEFTAEWVISSLHPKATFDLLTDQSSFPPVFRDRLRNLKESTGIFGVYAVCDQRPPTSPSRNYYFFRSDDPADMFQATHPGEEPPVVFMSSPKRHWAASDTRFPISLHVPGPYPWFEAFRHESWGRRGPEYKSLKAEIESATWQAVERHQPGLREVVARSLTSTALTHLHFNGSAEGSSYGLYHSLQNTGARALGPRTKVLNLLLTGQNCLFPGLLGAATSALRTCGHVIGIKPILSELKGMVNA